MKVLLEPGLRCQRWLIRIRRKDLQQAAVAAGADTKHATHAEFKMKDFEFRYAQVRGQYLLKPMSYHQEKTPKIVQARYGHLMIAIPFPNLLPKV